VLEENLDPEAAAVAQSLAADGLSGLDLSFITAL
jgi:hypothetical protein